MKRLGALVVAANMLMVFGVSAMADEIKFDKTPGKRQQICKEYMRSPMMGPFGRAVERLELTDIQKDQVKKTHLQHAEKVIELRNLLGEKEANLRTISSAKKVDMGDINDVIEEIGALRIKVMKNKESLKQSFRKILTDDQRIMFDLHSQRMGKRFGEGKRGRLHGEKKGEGRRFHDGRKGEGRRFHDGRKGEGRRFYGGERRGNDRD